MTTNPYRWQHDRPDVPIPRAGLVDRVTGHLRAGLAVELVGGRGMGKSVLLRQLQDRFSGEPDTRAVLVPSPPEEATQAACVRDLASRLGLPELDRISVDSVMEALTRAGVERLVVLIDEADQYLVGRWRVTAAADEESPPRVTEHRLVRVPKRT